MRPPSAASPRPRPPFPTGGALDEAAFGRLLDHQVDSGIDGLVPCGTTGESPTLTWEEHDSVIEISVEAANGKPRVPAGTGSNATEEAIGATQNAKDAGAHAALLVDCYYNCPSTVE